MLGSSISCKAGRIRGVSSTWARRKGGVGAWGARADQEEDKEEEVVSLTLTKIEYWDREGTSSRRLQRKMRYALESG